MFVIAHGLTGRTDLPVPEWLFSWAAAAVLVASFVALAALWPAPRLQQIEWKPLPEGLSRVITSRALEVVCGAIGVALLGIVVWSGLAGSTTAPNNIAPAFIYILFWLGLVVVSLLLGDVFRAFNPWRAVGRVVGGALKRALGPRAADPLPYPDWLGYRPAIVGLLAFAWMELVSANGDDPRSLAVATIVYSSVTWLGMALYGVERWTERGEAFSVWFGLLARISVWERREGRMGLRPPLSGLPRWLILPGSVGVVCVAIGTVSFDGFSQSRLWQDLIDGITIKLVEDGLEPQRALEFVYGAGLLLTPLVIYGFYRLGIEGARGAAHASDPGRLARTFAHTLVPIAFAYVAAHYVSLLLLEGQSLGHLASDPLGEGWDLFGTAAWAVNYGWIGAKAFWYLQVGFVVGGHVCALVLAHDRALATFKDPKAAVRSQYWLLGVMVGFTVLALWLLAQARQA